MAWTLAPALVTLRGQLDTAYPNRDRRSDGTIGDANHQARVSDHNPDSDGDVCALDITHGPYWGAAEIDCTGLVQPLLADTRTKYVIFQRRIYLPGAGDHIYSGPSPHEEHLHLSVTQTGKRDARPWALPNTVTAPPAKIPTTNLPEDDVKVFKLSYPNRVEWWLGYADGYRTMLNPAADVGDMQAIYPTVEIVGDARCNRWKNFTTERRYEQIAQRPLT